ncbi:MAG: F0F1 ATP synthase subunit epsilon [Chloroherpetonaceae bacterium]|nr:F0F1 ATP synthase subunit epsilon [Chloroherpetonaceae bacterium]
MAQQLQPFQFEILSPSKKVFSGDVISVTAPGFDGLFQVLKDHAPYLSSLTSGEVTVELTDKTKQSFSIDGGFFEVNANKAVILTEGNA